MAVHPLSSILSRTRLRFKLRILISAPSGISALGHTAFTFFLSPGHFKKQTKTHVCKKRKKLAILPLLLLTSRKTICVCSSNLDLFQSLAIHCVHSITYSKHTDILTLKMVTLCFYPHIANCPIPSVITSSLFLLFSKNFTGKMLKKNRQILGCTTYTIAVRAKVIPFT